MFIIMPTVLQFIQPIFTEHEFQVLGITAANILNKDEKISLSK